jgi:hypothetical protein
MNVCIRIGLAFLLIACLLFIAGRTGAWFIDRKAARSEVAMTISEAKQHAKDSGKSIVCFHQVKANDYDGNAEVVDVYVVSCEGDKWDVAPNLVYIFP